MPRPMQRTRSKRKIKSKTPGKRETTHFYKRKPQRARCASCGALLSGIARKRATTLTRISKTKKRPGRTHAGVYCHGCVSIRLKAAIRGN
ncbi:MAG: 50S ribosomal protein L34e [Candidatus Hodarchaeota archaeon]